MYGIYQEPQNIYTEAWNSPFISQKKMKVADESPSSAAISPYSSSRSSEYYLNFAELRFICVENIAMVDKMKVDYRYLKNRKIAETEKKWN